MHQPPVMNVNIKEEIDVLRVETLKWVTLPTVLHSGRHRRRAMSTERTLYRAQSRSHLPSGGKVIDVLCQKDDGDVEAQMGVSATYVSCLKIGY